MDRQKFREDSKKYWESQYGHELAYEEIDEINHNLAEFGKILLEWQEKDKEKRLKTSKIECSSCHTPIETIDNFHCYEEKDYCHKCFMPIAEEILKNSNRY